MTALVVTTNSEEEAGTGGNKDRDGGTHMRSKLHAVYGVFIVQRVGLH